MKIIFFLVFPFLLIVGCSSPDEPNQNSESYFPLKYGNKWYYSHHPFSDSISIIWEVTGQEEIDQKSYFRIVRNDTFLNLIDTMFYRFSGDVLFSRRKSKGDEILADFSLNQNDTTYWQNELIIARKTNDLMEFSTPFGPDHGSSITFKKGTGIIKTVQNGFIYYKMELIKAELK